MTIKTLTKEFDGLRTKLAGVTAELMLDVTGDRRQQRIEEIAAAERGGGGEVPDLHLDRDALALLKDGVEAALRSVISEMVAELQGEHRPIRLPALLGENTEQHRPPFLQRVAPTGQEMVERIEAAYERADLAHIASIGVREESRRHAEAVANFQEKRARHLGGQSEAAECVAATEAARAEMSADELDALFMRGEIRFGDHQLATA